MKWVNTDLSVLSGQQLHIWIQQIEVIRDEPRRLSVSALWSSDKLLAVASHPLQGPLTAGASGILAVWCRHSPLLANVVSFLGNFAAVLEPGAVVPFQPNEEWRLFSCLLHPLSKLLDFSWWETHLHPEQLKQFLVHISSCSYSQVTMACSPPLLFTLLKKLLRSEPDRIVADTG